MLLVKKFLVKKKTKNFNRYDSDRYKRIGEKWRKPRGIDSCIRRKFKGKPAMPNIGYGNNCKTRNLVLGKYFKVKISNVQDLNILLMINRTHVGQIAKNVSQKKKRAILEKAKKMDIKILNK
ncbi:60S ribosomal protein L32 (nucleomorph) [Cryptomonas paramecium]|uniref:60S ribosomal protein L32 n=1 Tax=Cryptomonas paramaecium TaxID=2898 RepID=F2HHP7_9CRYP|nr:60S ribosomal protein L32 [Cryptomonas paramecium]AEA38843.1 60S ribosomal protein L32 [Cryptomonas paramecium]|mmetsp:Transcript_5577/g.17789  ORF Transcript_5577/g.17789 Transcript_5577/m.17789 type:complete len:122 (-) Transcript_5577:5857-6222(-)